MDYEFSWGAFMLGILIMAAGAALLRFYQPLADNLGSGAIDYERFKLTGFIAAVVGIAVMINLHVVVLRWLFNMFF